jgi:hypothetical protein
LNTVEHCVMATNMFLTHFACNTFACRDDKCLWSMQNLQFYVSVWSYHFARK